MLTIEHLVKCYGGEVKAVDDLSLTVMPGDIYGFIGHNGAGKTTTLRAIAGILSFDSGTITVNGTPSPGDKLGTLTTGPVIMTNGSTFAWQVSNWIGAAARGALAGSAAKAVTEEQMELSRLRAENIRLKRENEIIKKAAAYFAKDVV